MNLKLEDFDEFFSAINNGYRPFSWQVETLTYLVEHGVWPEQICAPTGAGKSSVVDIHIFANALLAQGDGPRIPRRLHTVVNRRALVDNQHDHALRIQRLLSEASGTDTVLGRVAGALKALRVGASDEDPIAVAVLRGGLSPRNLPVADLGSCAVIASTPDMWGSRSLFRGYGATRLARPRETALLTMDSTLILDEAHLNRQLLTTARRIREIQTTERDIGIPRLQVVETTATPAQITEAAQQILVDPRSLNQERDIALKSRVNAMKALRYEPVHWTGRPSSPGVTRTAVEEISRLHQNTAGEGTVGYIVNHVETALQVTKKLRANGLNVQLLVGRLRPCDHRALVEEYPDLLTTKGDPTVDVIVATQTLEVGVDIDVHHLVTELAPASSLTQRFGRVNRLGSFDDSEVVVLGPESDEVIKKDYPPYKGDDLKAAYGWITSFSDGQSVNPASLLDNPAPASTPQRLLYQRLEARDVELFARTTEPREFEPQLELWLRDSLEAEQPTGGVVVRSPLPEDDIAALELLKALPPVDDEVFPATMRIMRSVIDSLVVDDKERLRLERENPKIPRRAFVYREGDVSLLTVDDRLTPGDVVVIDRGPVFTTANVASETPTDKRPPLPFVDPLTSVYVNSSEVQHLDRELHELFTHAVDSTPQEVTELWLATFGGHPKLSVEVSAAQVEDPITHSRAAAWIIVRQPEEITTDSVALEEWTPSSTDHPVFLEDHQVAVAERAQALCASLGVDDAVAASVVQAARLHDEGKSDPRFQKVLDNHSPEQLLAKSLNTTQQNRRRKTGSGLPARWRHEQLSALVAENLRRTGRTDIDELCVRIVGASHGHGRDSFPHTGAELLQPGAELMDLAEELFTTGSWDALTARVAREFGEYTVAFAEALERAADSQISGEGR